MGRALFKDVGLHEPPLGEGLRLHGVHPDLICEENRPPDDRDVAAPRWLHRLCPPERFARAPAAQRIMNSKSTADPPAKQGQVV